MASFTEFVRFCAARPGCDKGGLYAIQPRGLRGSPIKIGYSLNLLRRLAAWEYIYPSGWFQNEISWRIDPSEMRIVEMAPRAWKPNTY